MRPLNLLLPLLSIPLTLARQPPTSFCKCICYTNSTIIPLNSNTTTTTTTSKPLSLLRRDEDSDVSTSANAHKPLTCTSCTKAFCLDQNLRICQGAKEEDVFTSCFQRDSLKDETIVLLFLATTISLLGWAILRPWVEKVFGLETLQKYLPVGSGNANLHDSVNLGLGALRRGTLSVLPAYRDGAGENAAGVGGSAGGGGRHRTRERDGSDSHGFARQGGLNS